MKAYLEVNKVSWVIGKDENGNDLQLTRVSWHRYDKDEDGNVGGDHNDTGSTLFMNHISAELATELQSKNVAPDSGIEVFLVNGVEASA